MPAKELKFDDDARKAMRAGVDMLAGAVGATLGPRGRNVMLDQSYGPPIVTKDGVTVARQIDLKDRFENMGAQLVKQVAIRTNDVAGDGTTTATVLAQAILHEGIRNVAAGANPMTLRIGLEKGQRAAAAALRRLAVPVEGKATVQAVASIAANDPEIGRIIADVMEQVGKDGVITIEEGKSLHFETEVVDGLQIDHGYMAPYFVTNPDRQEAVLDDPYILITDARITNIQDLLPVLEKVLQVTKNIVIISDEISGDALSTLVVNKMRGNLNPLPVLAPAYAERRKQMLEDIAILTGGTFITEDMGRKLESATIADLGRAHRVVSDHDETTIIEGAGSDEAIQARIRQIRTLIGDSASEYDREKLQERLAKLAGGVAVIRIGGSTDTEVKEKKYRVEDALSATRSAVEEGVVPGGGVAYIRVQAALDVLIGELTEPDEILGVRILRKALESPLRRIVENGGREGAVVIDDVRNAAQNVGYDAAGESMGDMFTLGIIDPVKVSRVALESAVSVAAMMLTTEGAVGELPLNRDKKGFPVNSFTEDVGMNR